MDAADRYGRFFALLRQMPYADKGVLVEQFTRGRTTHLHEMQRFEYDMMCNEMARVAGYDERKSEWHKEIKRYRSLALHLMGIWGVDTRDWSKVDFFCGQKRIAGKAFRLLTLDDLSLLCRKIRSMIRKREQKNSTKKENP